MRKALWVVQGLLAVIFLLNGVMKLALPPEVLTAQVPLPALFVRFIGVCELLGALGLVLPGIFHIGAYLTPLAAAGLVVIMVGATVSTVVVMGPAMALLPLVVGFLAAFVAYGRWRLAPLGDAAGTRSAQPAG